MSRNVIGLDIDPLALKQGKAKTLWLDPQKISHAGQKIIDDAVLLQATGDPLARFMEEVDEPTRDFIDYWFNPETQTELAALVFSIRTELSVDMRDLFEVLLSSIIVTKSGGVSMARDLAHSRPHRVATKSPRNAIKMFQAQLNHIVRSFKEVGDIPKGQVSVLNADCRNMPLADESVDLIVTSPPYANAIDYMRAHKFSLVWLGASIKPLSVLRSKYIGSEKSVKLENTELPQKATTIVETLGAVDSHKAQILHKYLHEMSLVIQEMYRVIRAGRAVVIVVGPSTMRGLKIETHNYLASISENVGFELVDVVQRPINRDRRMLPYSHNNNGHSPIEQRTHQEYVLGLLKA